MGAAERLRLYIARKQRLAWLALAWERAWPAIAPLAGVAGLFVAVSLMDVLPALPGWLHAVILGVFALAGLAGLWWARRTWRAPTPAEARRRLEQSSDLPHRPLAVLDDDLATRGDLQARALWEAHQRRAAAALAGLKVGWPHPRLPAMDPHGLRSIVFLALFAGVIVGATEQPDRRLARAITPDFSGPAGVPAELQAWINPPAYTDIAPFPLPLPPAGEAVAVPTGSKFLARLYGGKGAVTLSLSEAPDAEAIPFRQADALNNELERELTGGERLLVRQGDDVIASWPIRVLPDVPPTVDFGQPPSATPQMALRLDYKAADDYGLAAVHAEVTLADDAAGGAAEPLRLDLPLPGINAREAAESGFHDLTAHPWAGLKVRIQLVAEDEIGQKGLSAPVETMLPARTFNHPVARALVEQRRILVQQAAARGPVILALSAISTGPETFDHDATVYLALRSAIGRLRYDRTATAIPEVQETLWQTALRLEDGRVSVAQQALRDAQQALMDALARDADDSEIQRLMDDLQKAIDNYLQALTEQAVRQAERGQQPGDIPPDAQQLSSDDLKKMLDRARELAQLGAKDAAREMLRQLQEMLENLQAGRMQSMPQEMQGMQKQMQELGDLMRQQQQLLDRTFRQSQQGRQQGQRPQRGQQPQQGGDNQRGRKGQRQPGAEGQDPQGGQAEDQGGGMGDMAGQQEALRQRLEQLLQQLQEGGGQAPDALGRAEQFMGSARDSLNQGEAGSAAQDQTQALDSLAQGMRSMAEDLARQMGGEGEENEGDAQAREEDPLGRSTNSGGVDTSRVEIPTQSDLQRAREILDELRRRAGERGRPEIELDYIERLLRRF